MAWPLSQDYNEAIQNPELNFQDMELKQGQPALNRLGLPIVMSGNFADVYRIHCPTTGHDWAVKCFTREVPGLQDRYREISSHLQQARMPFTVEFSYLSEGIRIRGQWFPVLKMEWVDGTTLNTFVRDNLQRPHTLEALAQLWVKLAQRLRDAGLAHADLQHGNVLLVPGSQGLKLRLIDYDGIFVPTLAGSPSGEAGHPAYQHPLRLKYALYNAEVDRFPHLVIGCALRSLALGGRALWDRYDNGDNLLFRQKDFDEPHRSSLLKELWQSRDPLTRLLAGHLVCATRSPLGQEPFLPDIIGKGQTPILSPAVEQRVAAILKGSGLAATPQAPQNPEAAGRTSVSPAWMSQALMSPPGPTSAPRLRTHRAVPAPTKPLAPVVSATADLTNSIGMEFQLIPAGSFIMGSNHGTKRERPAKQRTITRPFHLGIYEVTQEQYARVQGGNPSRFKNPTNPVEWVSWEDAVEYCRRLSELPEEKALGNVYRLPTEAEWEYAARAGSTGDWCFGDDDSRLGEFAWYEKNSGVTAHPVGQKRANAWGLYDMHGNVWEWCLDVYDESYYARAPSEDPWNTGPGSFGVFRGGGYRSTAARLRSAFRGRFMPNDRYLDLGFRVALSFVK